MKEDLFCFFSEVFNWGLILYEMEWSNEKIQLFIELYEEEPAIWNPKDPGHKSRNNVHDAWTKIKTKFCEGTGESISVEELKKKKENLMATYRKLNTKVKSSSTSGSGTDDMFKPNWPFYEQMAKFLHGVYKPTTTKSSEDTVDPDVELNEEEVVIREGNEDNVVDRENESSTNTDTVNPVIFKKPTNASNKKEVNRKRKIEHQMEQAYDILKKISTEPEPVEDECTLYTKLLCAKLKSMDVLTRDIAMHEIDNVMFRLKQQQAFPRFQSPPNQPYAGLHLPQNPLAPSYYQNMQSSVGYQTSSYQPSPQSHSQHKTNFQPSPQSHSQRRANFQPSPQSHSQQSAYFQPSPQSHSQESADFQPSPQSHSQHKTNFQPSPQSHSQRRANFQPSPQSHSQQSAYFQPSPQSHSQESADFQPSPQSHSQHKTNFQPSPQSHSQRRANFQPSPQSHSQQSAYFQPSPQSHSQGSAYFQPSPQSNSQESADFQPSPQSHSQESADFQPSPQPHIQVSADFQPSPHSISQQSSDMEEYSHSQPFPGFESLSKEQSIDQLYADAVSKIFEKSE